MCGIIGYIGHRPAVPLLIEGLKSLEYRGYDSAGIAVLSKGSLEIQRVPGKLTALEEVIQQTGMDGDYGVGHTRWATHGEPNRENAHPHADCHSHLVVVHNGIIENYLHLKNDLREKGHRFQSDTDSEVIAHLVEEFFQGNLEQAVAAALRELQGSYAFCVMSKHDPQKIVAAKNGPPLIVGFGEDENFLASDIPALLDYTKRVAHVSNGEMVVLQRGGVAFWDKQGKEIERAPQLIQWDPLRAKKGGFRHFMLKEIHEQPTALRETILERIHRSEGRVQLGDLFLRRKEIQSLRQIHFLACGTSYHACLVGKYLMEKLVRIPVSVDYGSEYRYRDPLAEDKSLAIAVSQSGETADTLGAVEEARKRDLPVLAICNVPGSMLAEISDGVLYTEAGPEIGVASTKAFTTQIALLYLLALHLADVRRAITPDRLRHEIEELGRIPQEMEVILENHQAIEEMALEYTTARHFLYLGRGIAYPLALEGALKLKEISYIHAEGYPAGEMKHGPIALINEDMPVVAIAPQDDVYKKMLSNIEEVKSRQGKVIAVATAGDNTLPKMVDHTLFIPSAPTVLTPLLLALPLQLFAYCVAVHLGCDVDQPRNLAKSVTVE